MKRKDAFYVNSKGAIIEVVDWNVSEFGGDDFFNPTTIEFEIKVWDRNLEVFYTDTIETYISCYGWMCDFMEDETIYLRERIEENDRDSVPDIDLPLYDYLKEHDENFWDEHCDELFYQMRTDEEFKDFCLEKISFLYWDDGCKVSEWTGDFDPKKLFGKFEPPKKLFGKYEPMGVKEDVLYPLF